MTCLYHRHTLQFILFTMLIPFVGCASGPAFLHKHLENKPLNQLATVVKGNGVKDLTIDGNEVESTKVYVAPGKHSLKYKVRVSSPGNVVYRFDQNGTVYTMSELGASHEDFTWSERTQDINLNSGKVFLVSIKAESWSPRVTSNRAFVDIKSANSFKYKTKLKLAFVYNLEEKNRQVFVELLKSNPSMSYETGKLLNYVAVRDMKIDCGEPCEFKIQFDKKPSQTFHVTMDNEGSKATISEPDKFLKHLTQSRNLILSVPIYLEFNTEIVDFNFQLQYQFQNKTWLEMFKPRS